MGVIQNWIMQNNDFNPSQIAGYTGDWDFTDSTKLTITSGTVRNVPDLSGHGYNLSTMVTAWPSWNASGYTVFSTGTGINTSSGPLLSQPFTVLIVMTYTQNPSGTQLVMALGNPRLGALPSTATYYGGSKTVYSVSGSAYTPGQSYLGGSNNLFFLNTKEVYGCVFNTSDSKLVCNRLFYDPYSLGSPGSESTTGLVQVGTGANCNMYRMLLYNRAITDLEYKNLVDYFISKYSITEKPVLFMLGDSIAYYFANDLVPIADNFSLGLIENVGVPSTGIDFALTKAQYYCTLIPKTSYILIEEGTNDVSIDSTWDTKYRQLVDIWINSGFNPNKICIITPPYQPTHVAKNELQKSYMNQIAIDKNVKYANCVDPTYNGGTGYLSDGIHPTSQGFGIMKDTILTAFV